MLLNVLSRTSDGCAAMRDLVSDSHETDRAKKGHFKRGWQLFRSLLDRGIVEVIRESYPDPTDATGKFVTVDVKAVESLPQPVTLADIKAEKKLTSMTLVKFSRLSVQPVTPEEWKIVCRMGGSAL